MLNGWMNGQRIGSGSVVWQARKLDASGKINGEEFVDMVAKGTPSPGHCNTMGTASTMNALAEALGMALSGSAAIPAVYRERSQMAYYTGQRIVKMVSENLRPSDILTRKAFENAIVVNTAIGGSSNACIHLIAIAKHAGVPLDVSDWDKLGFEIPLLLNMQPAGEMLGEEYFRAGGLPAIMAELLEAGLLPHPDVKTVNGHTVRHNIAGNLALLCDGDELRIDLPKRRVDVRVTEEELREGREKLEKTRPGGYEVVPSQTPWQELFRREIGRLDEGAVLKFALGFQHLAQKYPAPRDNH